MTKDIKDYLHLYLGCEIEHEKKVYRGTLISVGFHTAELHCDFFKKNSHSHKVPKGKDFGYFNILIERLKPILRPLSDMTEEEAIKLCSVYSPEAFGDYRFSKWVALRDENSLCYSVTNKNSDMSFSVDIEKMHIKVYEDGKDTYPGIENHTYFIEYLRMGFDIFDLIPSGLAIDKTKL